MSLGSEDSRSMEMEMQMRERDTDSPGDRPRPSSDRVKRKRVGRACDACRRKRVRCDGRQPTCIPCTNYGIPCTYNEKPKAKNPAPRPKVRPNEAVESRLERIERLLEVVAPTMGDGPQFSNQLQRRQSQVSARSFTSNGSPRMRQDFGIHMQDDGESSNDELDETGGEIDMITPDSHADDARHGGKDLSTETPLGSLIVNKVGDLQYLGPSSGLAVLSQAGKFLENTKTIQQHLHMSEFEHSPKEELLNAANVRLPPKDIADKYIDAYFSNTLFPMFHRPSFQRRADRMYGSDPPTERCFIASWNMVLAFGVQYATNGCPKAKLEETEGWQYFTRAHDSLPDLLQGSNLSALQALLLIVQYLQLTSRASRWLLMGACAQLAQALGLHRRSHGIRLDPVIREERLRTFWVCYVMDKTISMMVGRSSALQDFDCDVGLPSDMSEERRATESVSPQSSDTRTAEATGLPFFSFFIHNVRFARMVSKVYRKLYSAQAVARHTMDTLADAVGELDAELIQWRDAIPEEYRPENEVDWRCDTLHQHVLQLHLNYYNCMYTIHRSIFTLPFGPSPGSFHTPDKPLSVLRSNGVYGSAALSVGAARTCLRLVLNLSERFPDLADMRIWLMSYYPFSSVIALFTSILHNPNQASAPVDLSIISAAKRYFAKFRVAGEVAEKMIALATRFEQQANAVIPKATPNRRQSVKPRGDSVAPSTSSYGVDGQQQQLISSNGAHNGYVHPGVPNGSGGYLQGQPDDWSGWEQATMSDHSDLSYSMQPAYASGQTYGQEWYPADMQQSTEGLDLWQAPTNFEWEDWAAFMSRFPGEQVGLANI